MNSCQININAKLSNIVCQIYHNRFLCNIKYNAQPSNHNPHIIASKKREFYWELLQQ